jgi:hypothetical protein
MVAVPIEAEEALETMRRDCIARFSANPFCPIARLLADALLRMES